MMYEYTGQKVDTGGRGRKKRNVKRERKYRGREKGGKARSKVYVAR